MSIAVSVVVLVVGGLLGLPGASASSQPGEVGAAAPARAVSAPAVKGRMLRVKVGALPSGRRTVEVRGPGGFRKTLRKSTTLRRLAPGRYRITAATVTTKRFVAKAKVSKRKVRVTNKRGALVDVSYPVAVSTDLEVVRPTKVKSFVAPLDGTGKLVITEDLARGDIVAAGVSASTPEGMLVKVTNVVDSGRTSTYTVTQARIDQALPQGSFDTTMTADLAPPATARLSLRGRASLRGALGCTAGGGDPSISPEGGIAMRMSGSWGAGAPFVSVTLTPYAQAKIKAFVGAQVACKKEISIFDRSFTPITVMIGPVPFVVVPRLRMLAGADLSVNAGLSVDASARIDATLAATAAGSGLKTQVTGPTVTRSATVSMQGNASADLYARARFAGDIYGVGGPYSQVRVGVKGRADIAANPWWNLEAYAQAGIGVEVEKCAQVFVTKLCLSLSAGKDDLINASYPTTDAGGPFGTTPTSTPIPTPLPTPIPTPTPTPTPTPQGAASLVSTSSTGGPANDRSRFSSISADGRYIAYRSAASNVVPGDTNGHEDVFVWDQETHTAALVSTSTVGGPNMPQGWLPSISADGRYITYPSEASNIVPGDTNGSADVFVWDRQTGTTALVSTGSTGGPSNGSSRHPFISADGRFISYYSVASNIVPGDTNDVADVFVWDRQTGTTALVSRGNIGGPTDGHSLDGSISADGRYISYQSMASNIVPGDTNDVADVFVWDRQTGTTALVSTSSTGGPTNSDSEGATSLSADGRYISYQSYASNIVPGDTNGALDVFLWDRHTGTSALVSTSSTGGPTNSNSSRPSISADGRHIAYQSFAGNIVPGDDSGTFDVFVWDRLTGTTALVSTSSTGGPTNGSSQHPSISADGRRITYYSGASNVVPGDTNGTSDVFVWDRLP